MQRIEKSKRVDAPIDKVYQLWRNFENFPRFMDNVESVRLLDSSGRRSHWKVKGPLGTSVEYDAELTQDEPNRSIGWNSIGGTVETTGAVTFGEVAGQTEVHVVLQWTDPTVGAAGEAAARLLQDQSGMLEKDLMRFKDIAEGRVGSGSRI
jgi:uncharacterized membrane protein